MPCSPSKLPRAAATSARQALELYVTQSAVNRMLARMEEHLGVKLFERTHGKVTLTESGAQGRFSDYAIVIQAALLGQGIALG